MSRRSDRISHTPSSARAFAGCQRVLPLLTGASRPALDMERYEHALARRFIFVGDHRQLPPVLATRYGDAMLRESVFGALVDRGFDTMLQETYRLSAELAAWPSAQFYAGRLAPLAVPGQG